MEHRLVCQSCGSEFDSGGYPKGCPECYSDEATGRLEVAFDFTDVSWSSLPVDDQYGTTMWRYRELLPLLPTTPVTLGEGRTPLVSATTLSSSLNADVWIKNETTNPTWSFKDRLNSLLLSNAVAMGKRRIATTSTGNHGASTAAYARRAGIDDVVVLVPPETEQPLQRQIKSYGARIAVTEYEARQELLEQLVDRGWYPTVNVTEPYTGVPYSSEAYKTIAFELNEQMHSTPAAVIVPIGSGDGLYGVWKGFRELRELSVIETTPRMIGVQPAERPSVVEAFEHGNETVDTVTGPMPITTSTSGPSAGDHALRALRESNGRPYGIAREDVEHALRVAGRDGVFVEPASALTVAAVERIIADGVVERSEPIVCLATGAGVKWPDHTESAVGAPPTIDPSFDALNAVLEGDE